MKRDRLIDFLLGELPEEQAQAVARDLGSDPAAAAERDRYREAIALLRHAASDATWEPQRTSGRVLALRVAVAAAAVIVVAFGLFWSHRGGAVPDRIFEPGTTFGALLPEEVGADGSFQPTHAGEGGTEGYRLSAGNITSAALGARNAHPLQPGATIVEESELTCAAEGGARIELPHGGLLFLRPLATVQLRRRPDGHVALRLVAGDAATVVGSQPIHLAVDDTDLLLTQTTGATLLRRQPSDAICLRGRLQLHVEQGGRWTVREGERLPAACAQEPQSDRMNVETLELEWYFNLLYKSASSRNVKWKGSGVSEPITATDETLLYLRLEPKQSGNCTIAFGDGPGRTFKLVGSHCFELRVPIKTLGRGPVLRITPGFAVKQARLFDVEPR